MPADPSLDAVDAWLCDNFQLQRLEQCTTESIIPVSLLQAYGYADSFRHIINEIVCYRPRPDAAPGTCECVSVGQALLPAACLNIYPQIAATLRLPGVTCTLRTKVYRNEPKGYDGTTRFWEFSVREIVSVGTRDYVMATLAAFGERVTRTMTGVQLVNACDHFSPSRENQIRRLSQIQQRTKQEIVMPSRGMLAIGSINYHGTTFWRAVKHLADPAITEAEIVTGCIGFGLERCRHWLRDRQNQDAIVPSARSTAN